MIIPLCRLCATIGSTCSFWSSPSDDQDYLHVPRSYAGSRTAGWLGLLAWFNVYQGLRQRCELPRLVLNTFFGTVIIVSLRRFAATSVIVFEIVYFDDSSPPPPLPPHCPPPPNCSTWPTFRLRCLPLSKTKCRRSHFLPSRSAFERPRKLLPVMQPSWRARSTTGIILPWSNVWTTSTLPLSTRRPPLSLRGKTFISKRQKAAP